MQNIKIPPVKGVSPTDNTVGQERNRIMPIKETNKK